MIFIITAGEYDDYEVVEALQGPDNADMDGLYEQFRAEVNIIDNEISYEDGTSKQWITWLTSHGFSKISFELVDDICFMDQYKRAHERPYGQ